MGFVILILGGTAEGRRLAEELVGRDAVLSLAGRTRAPLVAGEVRIGGFGGVDGLRDYLRGRRVTAVVDATHPFADRMSANAAMACAVEGVALMRLVRPSWAAHPLSETWRWVDGHDDAARLTATLGARPLLTVGRQHTPDYVADLANHDLLARVAERPSAFLPANWTLITSRGPFTLDGERALMTAHRIDVLVAKDAGGSHTDAKLTAAAERGSAVVMIRRPPSPAGVPEVGDVAGALAWLG
ncbi:MAG TPA: cobalt-precorrin-6A reductase [Arachnia sp.]|nr:cobalt-precorrin-6A reductase [Arachnia sp.]